MYTWFDFEKFDFKDLNNFSINNSDLNCTIAYVNDIIENELKILKYNSKKLFIGGFSQGMHIAFTVGL